MVISIKRLSHTPSCLAFQRIFPKRKHDLKWELSPVNYPKNVRIAIRSLLEYINNIFKSFLCTDKLSNLCAYWFKSWLFFIHLRVRHISQTYWLRGGFPVGTSFCTSQSADNFRGRSHIREVFERFLVPVSFFLVKSIETLSLNLCRTFWAPMFMLKYPPFKFIYWSKTMQVFKIHERCLFS